jgi:hypothetical protein
VDLEEEYLEVDYDHHIAAEVGAEYTHLSPRNHPMADRSLVLADVTDDDDPRSGVRASAEAGLDCLNDILAGAIDDEHELLLEHAGATGVVWHAQIYPDDFHNPKHCTAEDQLKLIQAKAFTATFTCIQLKTSSQVTREWEDQAK